MSPAPEFPDPARLGEAMADEQMAEYAQATADRTAGKPTTRLDVAAYVCLGIFVAVVAALVVGSL